MSKTVQKCTVAAVLLGVLALTGHPALAEPFQRGDGNVRVTQAQGQTSGEAESGVPADQPAAPTRPRRGSGLLAGEDRPMDPEMMMRMKQMHGEMMGRAGDPGMHGGMMGGSGMHGGMCAMMMAQGDKELSAEQVRAILAGQIAWTGNKRLKVGTVEQTDEESYVADIVTVDDSLVQKVEVDRRTGAMRPVN